MTQEQKQQQDVGRMQSKPLEASPVVSNTTLAHDRLGGVVKAVIDYTTYTQGEQDA